MTFLALAAFASAVARASEPVVDCVEVKTRSADNPLVKVWYRVPRDYDPSGKGRMRTLILFGGRNCDGKTEVSGKLGWTEWADLNGIFLVAPTLKDDAYWSPEKWSGRALLDALSLLAARYRLSTEGLLFYGYSAGSQASNLFPAWRPDLCRAYVSHACGFFHAPASKMKVVSALVTCGDADTARYVISRRFVGGCRRLGVPVVWRSFPNHPHDVPPGSVRLAKEFLAHHHWSHPEDLGLPALPRRDVARFVGDDADGVYFAAGSAEAAGVMEEDRINLPSEAVARAWGSPGRTERGSAPSVTTNQIDDVQVVSVVPAGVRPDSRIVLLLGGRGWTGGRAVAELGFADWADGRNWCLVAPSFREGEYWNPASGSGAVIRKAIDGLCRRHGIRPLPVFVFGYSAGGQLAALLLESDDVRIGAWAVHGCGVYPSAPRFVPPGLVACGAADADRFRISRDFVYRYREAGGPLVWKPLGTGHELSPLALDLARLFFDAVAENRPCAVWGEDDVRRILPKERIDVEFRNPLYNARLAAMWRE